MTIETVEARNWRLKDQRYSLNGNQCENCWTPAFPPKIICPNCDKPMHKEIPVAALIDDELLKLSARITSFASTQDTTREVIPYSHIISKEILSGVIYEAV
jgi:hypothetical protein